MGVSPASLQPHGAKPRGRIAVSGRKPSASSKIGFISEDEKG